MSEPTGISPATTPAATDRLAGLELSLSTVSGLVLVLVLSLFAVAPLFYPGYFQTHSGFVSLWNISALRANGLTPGWTPSIAVDFAVLPGDGLLPYTLAALLPLAPITAVKLIIGVSWLLGGTGMFLWLQSWLGRPGAVISALVYVYLPYQIAAAYVRGAWAEMMFWGLLPWAILAATYLVTSPRRLLVPLAALFWLALGLTQLGLAMWAGLLGLALLLVVHRRQVLLPLLSIGVGLGLAAAFYRLAGYSFTAPSTPADHLLYPFQFFSALWGFGASRPGWDDGLSLQLGLAAVGLTIITLALWLRQPAHRRDRRLWFFLLAAVGLSLLITPLFVFLWRWPPLGSTLAFPWQLLGLAGLCLAVLAGALLWLEPQFGWLPLFAGLVLLVLLSVYSYLQPQFIKTGAIPPGPQAELGQRQLLLLDHNFWVQTPGYTVGLSRGETAIPLNVNGPLQPGSVMLLKVRWQPLDIFGQDYKIFVHLVDSGGQVIAQFDGYPQEGRYPTSHWVPGEIIEDTYPIAVPNDAPPGPYRVFLGLYNEATQERLPVTGDNSGRVILDVQ